MQNLNKYTAGLLGLLLTGSIISSCTKSFDEKISLQYDFSNSALVQVFLAVTNASRNYVYVDAQPVNGASLATGSVFPSTGPGFNVSGGVRNFVVRDTITGTTQVALSFAQNFQAGQRYTVFVYDTITSPKQKTVQTNIVIPSDTTCRIRFGNFVYNPNTIPAVDVFSFVRNQNIFTNINVTDVTDFIAYPSNSPIDTLYIRPTGTTTNLFRLPTSGLTQKRSYTVVYRGSDRGTRAASLFLNQ
jgi:hypothetical protein